MSGTEPLIHFFETILHQLTSEHDQINSFDYVPGGDINQAVKLTTDDGSFFLKWNEDRVADDLFEKELDGLKSLECGRIKIPKTIGHGRAQGLPFLLLEFVEEGKPDSSFWELFGLQLAQLHQNNAAEFGHHTDNYIGRLPQKNSWRKDWHTFFIENRLEPQLKIALDRDIITNDIVKRFEVLYKTLPSYIPKELASLLHGDLWSGNFMADKDKQPVIYDPAVYYGHREAELAFTKLFGGFSPLFYQGYENHYPLEPGFSERIELYNLYPLLVHVNLFGSSYLNGITNTLRRFT